MIVCIEPDFSLEDTARILGQVLDVSLKFDDSGYYEEFPAYSGVARDTQFALLGPPDPKYMVGDLWRHYELQAMATRNTGTADAALFTDIQERIACDGRLRQK